jgi:hypothetical protein
MSNESIKILLMERDGAVEYMNDSFYARKTEVIQQIELQKPLW